MTSLPSPLPPSLWSDTARRVAAVIALLALAGIGFGIFMSRVGAVAASGLGGVLLEWGGESVLPFFAVLAVSAALALVGTLVVDRHVPPSVRR